MASGRPIVVSADAGSDVATLVESARCGHCVPPGDPAALAEAIMSLYGDPGQRQALGEAGRRYAEQHLSPKVVVDQYHRLLTEAATPQRRQSPRPIVPRA
jgi:colanic acid biosynthesis glycosyl transferase WcaI